MTECPTCQRSDVVVFLAEDPYEADVNNNPGHMVWTCHDCIEQTLQAI